MADDPAQQPPSTRPISPLPKLPPIGWRDVACVGPLLVLPMYRYAGLVLNGPLIGTNPLLLSFLRGSLPSMIAAGSFARAGLVPLWLAVIAPLPILMLDDPFVYWAGRRYGRPLLNYMAAQNPGLKKQLPRAERAFSRFRVTAIIVANFPVNPLPMTTVVMFLAGETKMKFIFFFAVDIVSLLIFTGFWVGLGYWVGDPAKNVAVAISHYGLPITLVTIGIVVIVVWRSTRRTMRQMREEYGDDWHKRLDDE